MHEEASFSVGEGEAEVNGADEDCVLFARSQLRWEIVRGSEDPKLGWRSRRFNQKQPTSTLRIHIQIEGPTTIRTHLRINS